MHAQDDICKECRGADHCRAVYHRLGRPDTPPVTVQVVAVFLLPLVVLIVGWLCVDRLLPVRILGLPVGLSLAFISALGARAWISRSSRPTRYG